MNKPTQELQDIPGTRQLIHTVATRAKIYSLCAMAILGAIMFGITLLGDGADFLDTVPESTMMMLAGMICFALFFPWFVTLYITRHLLCSVEKLEGEVAELTKVLAKETQEPPEAPVPDRPA